MIHISNGATVLTVSPSDGKMVIGGFIFLALFFIVSVLFPFIFPSMTEMQRSTVEWCKPIFSGAVGGLFGFVFGKKSKKE